jgi:hypothetical protein
LRGVFKAVIDVVQRGAHMGQLTVMAEQARQATGEADLTVVADRGYFSGAEIIECANAGITPYVPRPAGG